MTERTEITIAAPASAIYAYASATERWPEFLPHYRYVRVLQQRGAERLVAMGAWRDGIPISWIARQTNDPERPAVRFHHVRGWTRGMDVEWSFAPVCDGTHVAIEHRLAFQFPVASEWLGRRVIGRFFVDNVARKTLACIKSLAEAGR